MKPAPVKPVSLALSPQKPPPSSSSSHKTVTSPQRMTDVKPTGAAPSSHRPSGQRANSQNGVSRQGNPQDTKVIPRHIKTRNNQDDSQERKADSNQMGKQDSQRFILQNLGSLCEHYSHDIHFAFVPPTTKSGIDLSGSFLRSDEGSSLDFFDLNEKGEITLQPRPPIFPEELPNGMREHSLRWWGIVDPAVGDGRFRTVPAETVPQHAAQPVKEDPGRQNDNHRRGEEYSNDHDRRYNSRDFPYGPPSHPGGPPPPPPHFDRPRGPDRRRDRR